MITIFKGFERYQFGLDKLFTELENTTKWCSYDCYYDDCGLECPDECPVMQEVYKIWHKIDLVDSLYLK